MSSNREYIFDKLANLDPNCEEKVKNKQKLLFEDNTVDVLGHARNSDLTSTEKSLVAKLHVCLESANLLKVQKAMLTSFPQLKGKYLVQLECVSDLKYSSDEGIQESKPMTEDEPNIWKFEKPQPSRAFKIIVVKSSGLKSKAEPRKMKIGDVSQNSNQQAEIPKQTQNHSQQCELDNQKRENANQIEFNILELGLDQSGVATLEKPITISKQEQSRGMLKK